MSFKCDKCGESHRDKTKPVKVVVETRERKDGSSEIAKEMDLCYKCLVKFNERE